VRAYPTGRARAWIGVQAQRIRNGMDHTLRRSAIEAHASGRSAPSGSERTRADPNASERSRAHGSVRPGPEMLLFSMTACTRVFLGRALPPRLPLAGRHDVPHSVAVKG
jgi:hypothetical protein